MADFGLLVVGWPLVPGCDAGGLVVKVGKNALNPLGTPFKEGDEVFGCTRLGCKGYSTWQEYVRLSSLLILRSRLPNMMRLVSDGCRGHHSQAR